MVYALIISVALLIVLILVDANGNRILFRMSIRNVIRRPGTTALVIGGLMIGTAIISASFVVGDTMDNMTTNEVTKGMGQVDFELQAQNVGKVVYYNGSALDPMISNISSTAHVRAVDSLIDLSVPIQDTRTQLFTPSVVLLGMDDKGISDYGGFIDQNGTQINTAPANGTIVINEKAAVDLNAQVGDRIIVFYPTRWTGMIQWSLPSVASSRRTSSAVSTPTPTCS